MDVQKKTIPTTDVSVQTEGVIPQWKMRHNCNCNDSIKATCAQVSTACGISTEMILVTVKTNCKTLYNYLYYLNIKEATTDWNDINVHQPKRPRIKKDYEINRAVSPSVKMISEYKQALQVQLYVAVALLNKDECIKVTLNFETTSRNSTDGQWPSLVLHFSNEKR